MPSSPAVSLRCFVYRAALAALLLATPARANVGPPSTGGQVVAEPTGLRDIDITRESLTIDLRPLATAEPARVKAVYHLHNRGSERQLELVFASGSERVSGFLVRLGDQVIPSRPGDPNDLPASWQPPKQTPGIHDDQALPYLAHSRRKVTPLAFTATVPPGRQTLEVRYEAEAAKHHRGRPTVYWQFAYVLAPAREWRSFGGVDVTVHLPPGWLAACTPEMTRDGDDLRASYPDLPADALALTVQAPVAPAYPALVHGGRALFALAGVTGALLCCYGGWSRGSRRCRAWPLALLLGAGWGLAVFALGVFAVLGPDLALSPSQADHYGYGTAFAVVGVVLLSVTAVPVGFALCLIAALMSRREPSGVAAEPALER